MNRVVGVETEYGCLVGEALRARGGPDAWPGRVKNYLFKKARAGALDLHYRDYEEPPGNGGFLCNGGRLYLDMGHLEYASPECRTVRDAVAYDVAGDALLHQALVELEMTEELGFIKNNVDHVTGATFGCHENYLMRRDLQFNPRILGTLLAFLATRQLFTGAGRVGQASPMAFEFEVPNAGKPVDFQLSQRADHIVNDIYQWVQFNRAIINARDEPLADFRRFRRLHLLIGDSNMSPFANALKLGTTALLLTLLEEGKMPDEVILQDAVLATRMISHEGTGGAVVPLEDGRTRSALDIQDAFLAHAQEHLVGRDEETDWLLESWAWTLKGLREDTTRLVGAVDWVSKRWLLESFRESEGLTWQDPWLQSLDLEYHHIHPEKGLFFALEAAEPRVGAFNVEVRRVETLRTPPQDTRAHGRGLAVAHFIQHEAPYVVNWDSVSIEGGLYLPMPDPLETYVDEVRELVG